MEQERTGADSAGAASTGGAMSAQAQAALFGIASADKVTDPATGSAPVDGVSTTTAPDGTVWTHYDIGKLLTEQDKMVLGWPCTDDEMGGMIAGMVASDRADGSLKGPLTADYILGDKQKGIAGIADHFPPGEVSSSRLSDLLKRL